MDISVESPSPTYSDNSESEVSGISDYSFDYHKGGVRDRAKEKQLKSVAHQVAEKTYFRRRKLELLTEVFNRNTPRSDVLSPLEAHKTEIDRCLSQAELQLLKERHEKKATLRKRVHLQRKIERVKKKLEKIKQSEREKELLQLLYEHQVSQTIEQERLRALARPSVKRKDKKIELTITSEDSGEQKPTQDAPTMKASPQRQRVRRKPAVPLQDDRHAVGESAAVEHEKAKTVSEMNVDDILSLKALHMEIGDDSYQYSKHSHGDSHNPAQRRQERANMHKTHRIAAMYNKARSSRAYGHNSLTKSNDILSLVDGPDIESVIPPEFLEFVRKKEKEEAHGGPKPRSFFLTDDIDPRASSDADLLRQSPPADELQLPLLPIIDPQQSMNNKVLMQSHRQAIRLRQWRGDTLPQRRFEPIDPGRYSEHLQRYMYFKQSSDSSASNLKLPAINKGRQS